jgi:hypothetical protein
MITTAASFSVLYLIIKLYVCVSCTSCGAFSAFEMQDVLPCRCMHAFLLLAEVIEGVGTHITTLWISGERCLGQSLLVAGWYCKTVIPSLATATVTRTTVTVEVPESLQKVTGVDSFDISLPGLILSKRAEEAKVLDGGKYGKYEMTRPLVKRAGELQSDSFLNKLKQLLVTTEGTPAADAGSEKGSKGSAKVDKNVMHLLK